MSLRIGGRLANAETAGPLLGAAAFRGRWEIVPFVERPFFVTPLPPTRIIERSALVDAVATTMDHDRESAPFVD